MWILKVDWGGMREREKKMCLIFCWISYMYNLDPTAMRKWSAQKRLIISDQEWRVAELQFNFSTTNNPLHMDWLNVYLYVFCFFFSILLMFPLSSLSICMLHFIQHSTDVFTKHTCLLACSIIFFSVNFCVFFVIWKKKKKSITLILSITICDIINFKKKIIIKG